MLATYLLLSEDEWDVFICVIVGTDRIQHLHWQKLVPEDGGPPDSVLSSYYESVDDHIGQLVDKLSGDDALLIISDHGFTRHQGVFLVNEWLLRNGWLKRREAKRSPLYPLRKFLNRIGINRNNLSGLAGEKLTVKLQLAASHIDWARTKAFHSSPFGIRINLAGREVVGTVAPVDFDNVRDAIMHALGELKDENGEPLMAAIHRREELYQGEAQQGAADIIFTFRDDRNHSSYAGEFGEDIFKPAPHKPGDHRIDGIFVAHGGGIKNVSEELRFKIWDVLPTLMHLNGRKVPAICDGRVLTEILTDHRDIEIDHDWQRFYSEKQEVQYDQAQENEIQERLKALGYMSDD
jgi:predicted AlkP superfamily phosphohydrolase/phosphomutase